MASFFRILLFALCIVPAIAQSSVAASVVLFDESHNQQFKIAQDGPLDLSQLGLYYQEAGFQVVSGTEALTKERLAAVNVLVISGAFRPLSGQELAAVIQFVENGGGLAVMLHVAMPVRNLLHRLDVDFTNGTLREVNDVIAGNPLDFKVREFADHPVTSGLGHISLYGSWALRGTGTHVSPLARTSKHGWVDLDRDNRPSKADAMQRFAVMVAGELGQGRYIVIGDDAVFQNRYLDDHNRKLALQMLDWLSTNH